MKTKIIYALVGLTSMFVIAKVDAATVFIPTDSDVNFLMGDLLGAQLAIFDDSDQSYEGSSLAVQTGDIVGFSGPNGGGNFIAINTTTANTLLLTGSDNFILGLSIDDGMSWMDDSSIVSLGANAYSISFGNGGDIIAVDVQIIPAVPLPAAVWLFGSGLLGLVGGGAAIRRRDKAKGTGKLAP